MSKTMIPQNYTPALNLYDTQRAIGTVKRLFADTLCATLNLYRVSAPLFLEASLNLNHSLLALIDSQRLILYGFRSHIHFWPRTPAWRARQRPCTSAS